METIIELEKWMEVNKIKNIFIPNNKNNRYVSDTGLGLEEVHGLYIWYYFDEKGNRTDLNFFRSEKEAIQFVYDYLLKNKLL